VLIAGGGDLTGAGVHRSRVLAVTTAAALCLAAVKPRMGWHSGCVLYRLCWKLVVKRVW